MKLDIKMTRQMQSDNSRYEKLRKSAVWQQKQTDLGIRYEFLFELHAVIPFTSLQSIMLHNQPLLLLSLISVLTSSHHAAPYHHLFSILLSVPPLMSTQSSLHPLASTDRHVKRAFLKIPCNLVSAVIIRMMDCQILIWNQTIAI